MQAIVERQITLRDLAKMKAGDVIPIEMPDTIEMMVNRVPLFNASLGVLGPNLALKIIDKIERLETKKPKVGSDVGE